MADQKRWVSNDGRAEIWVSGPHLRARVPLDPLDPSSVRVRELLLYQRSTERGDAWVGKAWVGDDLDVLVVVSDREDMVAARTISRPHAAGGERDPRGIEADYRCAPVIAVEAREPENLAALRRLAGLEDRGAR